jgi:hypothetical protein
LLHDKTNIFSLTLQPNSEKTPTQKYGPKLICLKNDHMIDWKFWTENKFLKIRVNPFFGVTDVYENDIGGGGWNVRTLSQTIFLFIFFLVDNLEM